MRLIIFLALAMLLLVSGVSAKGLEITEIDVNVDYDEAYTYRVEKVDRKESASVSVSNNSKIDVDLLPGSNITFTVRVENTFDDEKLELKDISLRITLEDIDDGADLEQTSLDFELEPGDDERIFLKFGIPLDADAGTYNTVLEAEGEDKNGTQHLTKLILKLELRKQSHDIRITKAILSPSVVDCNRKSKLTAEIMNLGLNAENQIALELKAPFLGINSFDKDISLESSDEASEEEKTYSKTLNIEIPPFFKAGTYIIIANLYWKNFVLFDQKTIDLVVKDCQYSTAKQPKEEAEKEKVEVIEIEEEQQMLSEQIITATQEASLNPVLLAIIFGIPVLVLVALIIVVYYKKSR